MINEILGWLPWLGGASTVALIAVAILAPSVLQVAGNWLSALSPLLRAAAEGIAEAAKALWAGFLDMTDNGRSILFVGAVALCAYVWGYSHGLPVKPERALEKKCNGKVAPPLPKKRPSSKVRQERTWMDDVFGL